jgi:hypothetical protein
MAPPKIRPVTPQAGQGLSMKDAAPWQSGQVVIC